MSEIKDLINKQINSDVAVDLYNTLINIWADDEFILGIFLDLEGDEKKQKMIEILNSGLTDTDEIILMGIAIRDNITLKEVKEQYEIDW